MISALLLKMESVIVWEKIDLSGKVMQVGHLCFFDFSKNQRIYCPTFGESIENLTKYSADIWYLVGSVQNFCVRCTRHMDTPYIAYHKFARRMSKHHNLPPIWDLHFLKWIKLHWYKNRSFRVSNMSLNAIHSRTTSRPPDLLVANLVTNWSQEMVWLMHTSSAKTWKKWKQSVKRMTRRSKHHKLLPLWHLSLLDETPWYSVGTKTSRFLPKNLSSNAGGRPSVSVLPLVIRYISGRCLARQPDHHDLDFSSNQIGDEGIWWVDVGGASLGSCASGWIRAENWGASLYKSWEIWDRIWSEVLLLNLEPFQD